MPDTKSATKLAPLKVFCTTADCANGLHAFRPSRDMRGTELEGACRECRQHLIPWDQVHARDINDVGRTFASLRVELIRHYFWHIPMPQRAVDYATRKGWAGLRERIPKQLRSLVGGNEPFWDGRQTPREDSNSVNAIHIAQHATASCCRKCIEVWHGIPQGRELNSPEIGYLSELALRYLQERLPNLDDVGKLIPRPA